MTTSSFYTAVAKLMEHIYVSLCNYATNGAITKEYVDNYAQGWEIIIVDGSLPVTGAVRTYYFKRGTNRKTRNNYDIYIWVDVDTEENGQLVTKTGFEKIGQVAFDMKDHYTVAELEAILTNYRDANNHIPTSVSNYIDDIGFVKIRYTDNNTPLSDFDISIDDTFPNNNTHNLYDPLEITSSELAMLEDNLISIYDLDTCVGNMADMVADAQEEFETYTEPNYLVRLRG